MIERFIVGQYYRYKKTAYSRPNDWNHYMATVLDGKPTRCTRIGDSNSYASFENTQESSLWDWADGFRNWEHVPLIDDLFS